MQNSKKNNNLPAVITKEQQYLAVIVPKINAVHDFINMTKMGKIAERDRMFGVYTLERIVKSLDKSLKISSITKHYPEKSHAYLKQMIFQFCEDMNYQDTLTPGNMEELVSYFQNELYFYTFSDIHVMFDMFKRGQLIGDDKKILKCYGSVKIADVYNIIKAYDKIRNELIVSRDQSQLSKDESHVRGDMFNHDPKKQDSGYNTFKLQHIIEQQKNKKENP